MRLLGVLETPESMPNRLYVLGKKRGRRLNILKGLCDTPLKSSRTMAADVQAFVSVKRVGCHCPHFGVVTVHTQDGSRRLRSCKAASESQWSLSFLEAWGSGCWPCLSGKGSGGRLSPDAAACQPDVPGAGGRRQERLALASPFAPARGETF